MQGNNKTIPVSVKLAARVELFEAHKNVSNGKT